MDRRTFLASMAAAGAALLARRGRAQQTPRGTDAPPDQKPVDAAPPPHRALDFEADFDVVVAGGGVAGVAAALAAARDGAKTCLLEKTVFPGGLATTGCILHYLPLSDCRGNQVTFGISEELLLASLKYGPGDVPPDWMDPETKTRYTAKFNPASFILAMDELLGAAGVDVWLDTLVCGARVEAGRLAGIEVENKSGRGLICGKVFVDATGDADIAHRAGAPCATGKNRLAIWSLAYSLDAARQAVAQESGHPLMKLVTEGALDDGSKAIRGVRSFSGVDGQDVSEFVLTSRRYLLDYYKREQAKRGANGRKDIFPAFLPGMADFRTTRRIDGIYTMGNGDKFKHFPDSVGIAAEWYAGRTLWETPYRALLPKKARGLLVAGRCMGAAGQAWSVMRVIQSAAMTGEVCGLAAARSVDRATTPDKLDVPWLQGELVKRKFVLDVREIKTGEQVADAPAIAVANDAFYD
jgi:hypothetical protein